jgi:hypothetical protein
MLVGIPKSTNLTIFFTGTASSNASRSRSSSIGAIRDILGKIRLAPSAQKPDVSPQVNAQNNLGLRKHRDSLADIRKLDSKSGHEYVPSRGFLTEECQKLAKLP